MIFEARRPSVSGEKFSLRSEGPCARYAIPPFGYGPKIDFKITLHLLMAHPIIELFCITTT